MGIKHTSKGNSCAQGSGSEAAWLWSQLKMTLDDPVSPALLWRGVSGQAAPGWLSGSALASRCAMEVNTWLHREGQAVITWGRLYHTHRAARCKEGGSLHVLLGRAAGWDEGDPLCRG